MVASCCPRPPDRNWVDLDLTARLNDTTMRVRFLYDTADPYAVTLLLNAGTRREVEWVFARDLLACGLIEPSGDGDVRIRPDLNGPDGVLIELNSPSGHARLSFPRGALEKALHITEDLVAPGSERVDWEREWDLLAGGPA